MKKLVRSLLALSVLTLGSFEAAAQDLGQATLEDLLNIKITTATRTLEGVGEAPARVQVVTASDIRRRGYRSLADLLKDLVDFKVDIGTDADYPTEIVVQGMRGASRVVLLLDGIRISSPTNEPLPILANYPVHAARQVEIVYGPASAVYGADAFSAVVNIISREAKEAPGLVVGASAGQFGLSNQTASYGVQFSEKTSLTVAGQFLYDGQPDMSKYYPGDFGGLTGQRSGVFNTIFGPMAPGQRLSPDFHVPLSAHSVHASLRAGGFQAMLFESHARTPTPPPTTPDNAAYTPDAFNLNRLLVAAGSYTKGIGGVTSTSTLTFSRHELDPDSGYLNVYSNLTKSYKYAYGSMLKAEQQLTWKPARRLTVTTGGTVERFFSIPQGADLNGPVRSHDEPGTILGTNIVDEFFKVRYTNSGVFAQGQYGVAPGVTVTLGARGDYNSRFGGTFNPRVGLVLHPAAGTTVKVLYGGAYLAPSPYQSYAHYGSFYSTDGGQTYASSYWHLGNANLEPQKKTTTEVNLLQALGRSFQLSASGFYSRFTNTVKTSDPELAYSGLYLGWPVDYIDFPVNEGRAVTYGGTAGLNFMRVLDSNRSIEARAAVAFADGEVWDQNQAGIGVPIGSMVPLQFRFGAEMEMYRWVIAPRAAVIGTQRLDAILGEGRSTERRTLAGYTTVDLTVRRIEVFKNIDLFAMVENAFDRRYRAINTRAYSNPEELIGAPQNPRRFAVGFDVRMR